MTNHFGFKDQRELPTITQSDIDAFNADRFKFASEVKVGRSPFEALREASLKLFEAAMGEDKHKLPVISDTVLERYTGTGDENIW